MEENFWDKKADIKDYLRVFAFIVLSMPFATGAKIMFNTVYSEYKRITAEESPGNKRKPGKLEKKIENIHIPVNLETESGRKNAEEISWKESLYSMIKRHEGKRNFAYPDINGNKTIGIGFNLERADATEKLKRWGYDFDRVYCGKQPIRDEHIQSLFKEDAEIAIKDAEKYLPNFNEIDDRAKKVVVDMAFNLGYGKLRKFRKMREALLKKDYETAGEEMKNSRWYSQVGSRSRELVEIMKNIN